MKNLHVIATDKPSRIKQEYMDKPSYVLSRLPLTWRYAQHICITSDEGIKDGDWYLDTFNTQRIKANEFSDHKYYGNACKKIILTTDQDLINDGVQGIDDEFLNWFVKNPSCENLEVEENKHLICNHCDSLYSSFSDGIHCDVCVRMSKPIVKVLGYKIIIPKDEPKQETLEEVEIISKQRIHKYRPMKPHPASFFIGFRAGAEWQQERMYSEEEVKKIIDATLIEYSDFVLADITEWFQQFKKK